MFACGLQQWFSAFCFDLYPVKPCFFLKFRIRNSQFKFGKCRYSYLNATNGSTLVARRAGTRQATKATTASSVVTPANVSGSWAVTPKSKLCIKRVKANEH